ELKQKFDDGKIKDLQQLEMEMSETARKTKRDPVAIPYLIALIDADNSYATVYGIGYFGLGYVTDVKYSPFHDGAFWKRWWEKNKSKYPENVQNIPIPELPKTEFGKKYTPFPESLETFDGQLEYLKQMFEPKNGVAPTFKDYDFYHIAESIAGFNDPAAIPYLIAAIDADNSYATVYGIGYFGLGYVTDVKYSPFHDGAFWKRWWEKNKSKYPENVQNIPIPEFPKSKFGKKYKPFPEDTETLQGQLRYFQERAKKVKKNDWYDPIGYNPDLSDISRSISEFNDPTAIPFLISAIDADNSYATVYGIGYFGLGYGRPPLTDVKYDESHNGDWWKKWWEENKKNYPEAVQKIPIPSIHDEWDIPDLTKEVAAWRQEKEKIEQRQREENMTKELADSDVADVPAELLCVTENDNMRYFLIGVDSKKPAPESGYQLVIVMPGGDGSADFHPFVRRIWKYAMAESNFIIAQPIALKWTEDQYIVWPTETNKVSKQEFSTEKFVESVISDVSKRVKVDPKHVYTLSWSSSGPAAYATALQEKTQVTGSYILMSVFFTKTLPPLTNAKGRFFAIQHSPDDQICPFRLAKEAEEKLKENGAEVKFTESSGGHGWQGDIYGTIRENIDWLNDKTE
ncbi:MAG: hypothetical protein ACRC2T_05260, partial [Thermoguttaceae bacterium]